VATITKRELCERLATRTNYTQVAVKKIVQSFLDEVVEELSRNNRLEFRDFGVFDVKIQAERKARNPRTGDEVVVPAKTVVHFKAGKMMSQRVKKAIEHVTEEQISAAAANPDADDSEE